LQAWTPVEDEQDASVEQFVRAFDDAWSRNDVEAAVALFAPDATVESPLVMRLLHREEGICRGRDEIRGLVRALMQQGTPWGRHEPPIASGSMLALEFRSPPSAGEALYSVDIIELRNGKIQALRAYVGWRAVARVSFASR
jgi:ketosteroid isomerase-like protein